MDTGQRIIVTYMDLDVQYGDYLTVFLLYFFFARSSNKR